MSSAMWITGLISLASLLVFYQGYELPELLSKFWLAAFMISLVSFLFMAITEISEMQDAGTNGARRDITESDNSSTYISGRVFYPAIPKH